MTIKNLTPHTINIHTPNGIVTVSPSGTVARVATESVPAGEIEGIPLYSIQYGAAEDLPMPTLGTIFVVSGMVASASPREDVFSPGELIRDENGQPVGCKGLKRSL